ncbi:hypothetical protein CQ019_11940 [Arthrobacter sp. MYb229]|uniref:hypothetical protein n=1 Tax=Micrococcaceae TaxID=1268 RepID=UPI000CFBECC1|nr:MULTISPECIES: hypothetical protein [unclassified Arthrobacter]PRA03161.1 hypothetical protein CQ019_11940 [Arthrobacter sp. MYb229]PRB49632.1 hypothetical protein CQ013_13420 [Arthrobacter sp. MYb216]
MTLFALSGAVALFGQSLFADVSALFLQLVITLAYRLSVGVFIQTQARDVARIYRRNTMILVVASVLSVFEPLKFAVALLLMLGALLIAQRAWRYGHPEKEDNDVPLPLQWI